MSNQTYKKTKMMLIITIMTVLMGAAIGASGILSTSLTLQSSGSIKAINVGVYNDLACTQEIASLDWGTPEPGDVVNKIVYVKNNGNADMDLSLTVNNWTPVGASIYLTVDWNRQGYVLSEDQVVEATITLDVSSSITGIDNFSFEIVIEGTG